jgi:hypothetical protein
MLQAQGFGLVTIPVARGIRVAPAKQSRSLRRNNSQRLLHQCDTRPDTPPTIPRRVQESVEQEACSRVSGLSLLSRSGSSDFRPTNTRCQDRAAFPQHLWLTPRPAAAARGAAGCPVGFVTGVTASRRGEPPARLCPCGAVSSGAERSVGRYRLGRAAPSGRIRGSVLRAPSLAVARTSCVDSTDRAPDRRLPRPVYDVPLMPRGTRPGPSGTDRAGMPPTGLKREGPSWIRRFPNSPPPFASS